MAGFFVAVILVAVPAWRIGVAMREDRFDELILKAAAENGCDPCLIKAVVWRESRFDSRVRGKDGEIGLMQVMPSVAKEWAASHASKDFKTEELLNPAVNLRVGAWYFSKALQQWAQASDPVPLALAQYNAGRSNVRKWVDFDSACMADADDFLQRIQFPSTRSYVRDILRQYQFYRQHGEF